MHYIDFLERVEQIISDRIRGSYPRSWDENHITYSIAEGLARMGSVQVHGFDRTFKTTWDALKLRGSVEQSFGDLAVVVRLRSGPTEELNGVGLLEAKRRDIQRASFGAIKKRQLETIFRNAPASRLLLYDYESIHGFGDNLVCSEYLAWHFCSQCVVVPTGIPLSTGIRTTNLYKYSLPFSRQLCGRYLRGLDLEYRDITISKVKKFVNRSGGPRYLLLVGVSTGDADALLPDWISQEFYEPLRTQ